MPNKLNEQDYVDSAKLLGLTVAHIKAVAEVESAGDGFNADGTIKLQFEEYVFHRQTGGKYDNSNPRVSAKAWSPKLCRDQKEELSRFNEALKLDKTNTLLSASYGKFQIMGFNYKQCGYATVEAYYNDVNLSEKAQLVAFCNFIKNNGLVDKLKREDWAGFAEKYNGPKFKAYSYDLKLKVAFNKFKGL